MPSTMAKYKDIRNEFKRLEISSNKQNPQELHDEHLFQLSKRITDETTRRELGLSLGLKHHEVKVTRTDNRDEITIATFEMLQKWCQRKQDRHTAWLELTKALRKAGLDLYIEEVLNRAKFAEIEKSSPTEDKNIPIKLEKIHGDIKLNQTKIEKLEQTVQTLSQAIKNYGQGDNIYELGKLQKRSSVLTKDVLEERCHLEDTIEGIQRAVKLGLNKLEQLRWEHQALDHYQSDIDKNKHFTYTVDEQVIETEPTNPGYYTTNCISCNRTCHEDCTETDLAKCPAMRNGYCKVCPGHCEWSMHRNNPYVYVIRINRVTKIAEELKRKYEEALGKKATQEQLVQKCKEEFDDIELRVIHMVEQARKGIVRLSQIEHRPNPLSTEDYIDILITSEKAEARPGWKEQIEQLVEVKEKAEQMQAIAQQGYDPFAVLKQKHDDERKQRQQMLLQELNQ